MPSLRATEHKYVVALVAAVGLFMNLLDMTIIHVAIPTLARDLDTSIVSVGWVTTGYMVSLAVFIPVAGWAGDRFGTKRMFMVALALFTLGSGLCALAWNIESLIAFRLFQGAGGGLLNPTGMAMVFRAFPATERSKAAAAVMIPGTIAPASGPIVGGFLVEYWSWEWIFLVNIPVGILGLVAAGRFLREYRQSADSRLDPGGLVLGSSGVAALLYALSRAGQHGFTDGVVLLFAMLGAGLLVGLVVLELHVKEPMVDVRLFKRRMFAAANAAGTIGMIGVAGALFLFPVMLQLGRGLSPLDSGLITFSQALGVMSVAPVAARLYDRLGPQRVVGFALAFGGLIYLSFTRVDLGTNEWLLRGLILCTGWAFGLMQVPLQAATFSAVPAASTGRASSITACTRQVGMGFGVALAAAALTSRLTAHGAVLGDRTLDGAATAAFQDVFLVLGLTSLVAAGIAASLLGQGKRELAPAGAAAPAVD